MKKRVLSLVLTVVLVCALLPTAALAGNMDRAGKHATVCAGDRSTAAIDENGTLWKWGSGTSGQLGNGAEEASGQPVRVMENVAAVSCGNQHTAALKKDGTLWMWGRNDDGQLGNGGVGNAGEGSYPRQTVPVKVMDNVAAVSCGTDHTAALKTDGTLWTWGNNWCGPLGNGTTTTSKVPVKVLDNVAAVSCGGRDTAVIKADGSLWMWGDNDYGQLGNGTTEDSNVPVKVLDNVAAVSCGRDHAAAIKTDGSLWTWGNNTRGQLGNGGGGNAGEENYPKQTVPVKVMDNVAAVSCGNFNTAILQTDHSLWMCGANTSGTLGAGFGVGNAKEGGYRYQTDPLKVMDNVAEVAIGHAHVIARKEDGTLWTWGDSGDGVLGNNIHMDTTTPGMIALDDKRNWNEVVYSSTQKVDIDGNKVELQMYSLKDAAGNDTNYVKLRDVAYVLNGSAAQFEVTWVPGTRGGSIRLTTKKAYTPNGSEMKTPFSGIRAFEQAGVNSEIFVNDRAVSLQGIVLKDDNGNGYTYFKLRDLGAALGFKVDWTRERGIFIETK